MTIRGGWMDGIMHCLALGNGSSGVNAFFILSSFAGLRSASHRKKVLVLFYSDISSLFLM